MSENVNTLVEKPGWAKLRSWMRVS